ncbi:hypothetical protein [Enterovibrio norvegicus]|uniref:Phage abortive infection protein n=1 Tax=Enterovibrio norvegicus TaxID=188144 RepID=A0A2N7L8M2_9GAMM|nr:hypothetical protein [Enterovibrio norvegicus]PMN90590.1 hypothetical protein BCT23_19420 [Enterovibrio norvegicus]
MFAVWVIATLTICLGTLYFYYWHFTIKLGMGLSEKTSDWAAFADFTGGVLGPILSFISLIFLVHSLNLQRKSNLDLRKQIRDNEINEKVKSFETHLFNMINSQSQLLESFSLLIPKLGVGNTFTGVNAIIELENELELIALVGVDDEFITDYLEDVDQMDKIFSATRVFYIMIKLIEDRLSDKNGFNKDIRCEYYVTVINYTDFALIRLIMMSIQFFNYHSTSYLKNNIEFSDKIHDLGLSYSIYNRT